MQNIHDFSDYRDFIKDRLANFKDSGRPFSFQNIAKKIKTTKSYLKLVIDKKRHASIEKVLPLAQLFELNDYERQYFIFLFLKNTTKNAEIKEFFNAILGSYHWTRRRSEGESIDFAAQTPDEESYLFRNWILMALHVLVRDKKFQDDPEWVQKRLGGPDIAPLDAVKNSLETIKKNGTLIQENGIWTIKHTTLVNQVKPTDIEQRQRFKTGLFRSSVAIEKKGKTSIHRPSRFQMYCLGVSLEDAEELNRLYDELGKKIIEIGKKEANPERIIFISNNMFGIATELE